MTDDEQDLLAGYRALHDTLSDLIETGELRISGERLADLANRLAALAVLDQKVRDFDEQDQCS